MALSTSHSFRIAASAARTATASFGPFAPTQDQKGVRVYIDATAETDTASVVFSIEVKNPGTSDWITVLDSAAVTAVGNTMLEVYPGGANTTNEKSTRHIGKGFRVTATHADADALTYSIYGEWLP